ncbi:MAG: hypothetical protein JWM95_1774 [Gemmatimonadetes bacterium]|nr:hypothetical protein [Gemmatimonadota bacterium]
MNVSILVNDDSSTKLSAVVTKLRTAGVVVKQVQNALGTVTGSVPYDRVAKVRAIPGVEAVHEERGFSLAPPHSDLQ